MKHCIIAYFACAFTFCSSMICNAQPSVSVSVRDLENLAIIDDVRQSTLEKMLNHCYTQTGKDYFQQSLCTLTCDISELKQRQKHLRTLVDHPEATFKINDLLAACGRQESILDVLGGDTRLAVLDEFYFKRASCLHLNNNPAALNASFFLHYVHLFTPLVEDALLHVGINSVFGHNHHHHHEHHHHNGVCDHSHNDGAFKQTMYYAVQGAHWALHMPGYYEMVIHIQTRAKKIAAARADIVRVKKYFKSIRSI